MIPIMVLLGAYAIAWIGIAALARPTPAPPTSLPQQSPARDVGVPEAA